MQAPSKPSFREAFLFWLKLGFISFGGPAGQIALMHAYLVRKKKWISESRFRHALNYCTILPGPEAQQLSIYSGWLLHGVWGGVLAGVLFVLPSVFILLVLSLLYVSLGDIPWFRSVFDGLKPAIMAIVLLAIYRLGKRALHSVLQVSGCRWFCGDLFSEHSISIAYCEHCRSFVGHSQICTCLVISDSAD
jgi:chromate transporter